MSSGLLITDVGFLKRRINELAGEFEKVMRFRDNRVYLIHALRGYIKSLEEFMDQYDSVFVGPELREVPKRLRDVIMLIQDLIGMLEKYDVAELEDVIEDYANTIRGLFREMLSVVEIIRPLV